MNKQYDVTIINGTGSEEILNGTYSVSVNANGYDNSSISPSEVTFVEGTDEYSFTVAGTGSLTLHVTDDGTISGTPIVGATFIRCDENGSEYGSVITTDDSGNAVFENLPYAANDAPTIYYKQKTSDGDHEFDDTLKNTTLTSESSTIEVENPSASTRTILLTDANYENLPIGSATISFIN